MVLILYCISTGQGIIYTRLLIPYNMCVYICVCVCVCVYYITEHENCSAVGDKYGAPGQYMGMFQ